MLSTVFTATEPPRENPLAAAREPFSDTLTPPALEITAELSVAERLKDPCPAMVLSFT